MTRSLRQPEVTGKDQLSTAAVDVALKHRNGQAVNSSNTIGHRLKVFTSHRSIGDLMRLAPAQIPGHASESGVRVYLGRDDPRHQKSVHLIADSITLLGVIEASCAMPSSC